MRDKEASASARRSAARDILEFAGGKPDTAPKTNLPPGAGGIMVVIQESTGDRRTVHVTGTPPPMDLPEVVEAEYEVEPDEAEVPDF